ncbi:MAG: DUF1294 domain-containing protein [Ruminococcaceae bacterium]|nr:DUF1294 domain-containing protein [Oscillospiraceae bacterium]
MIIKLVLCYLLLINIFGFILMGMDKRRAKYRQSRIPERTLFLVATVGGAFGMLISMNVFRHKTRHNSFRYGVPAVLLGQLAVALYIGLRTA